MFDVEFYDADGTRSHNANVGSLEELAELAELAQGRSIKIIGKGVLDTGEALIVIEAYKADKGLDGILETLQAMKADPNLTHHQQRAFNHVFAGFRKLFHGEEA